MKAHLQGVGDVHVPLLHVIAARAGQLDDGSAGDARQDGALRPPIIQKPNYSIAQLFRSGAKAPARPLVASKAQQFPSKTNVQFRYRSLQLLDNFHQTL